MIVFPAIDIKAGKVVRLKQGDYQEVTEYHEDPVDQAQQWADQGAEWIHIVDLDAAKSGSPVNRKLVAKIADRSTAKIQIGGGIRSLEMAQIYFEEGISRVVVGTRAAQDPDFLHSLGKKFPNQVMLGLDTKAGKIAIHGWTETIATSMEHFLQAAPLEGIYGIIFTDIARDGMLTGPNIEALQQVMAATELPVIASGGIASLADLRQLLDLENCKLLGAIVGKALYEGKFTLEEAIQIAKS